MEESRYNRTTPLVNTVSEGPGDRNHLLQSTHYDSNSSSYFSNIDVSATGLSNSDSPSWISWKTARRILGGVVCVLIVVSLWITQAQVLGKVQKGSNYHKDYFLTYAVHATYAFALLPWAIWHFAINPKTRVLQYQGCSIQYKPRAIEQEITNEFLLQSAILSILIAGVGYAWYFSLPRTSLSANTAIYNCSPALVYLFSIFILNDSITPLKVLSVLCALSGVVVVALFGASGSDDDNANTLLGLVMVAVSAICYALYEVYLGKMLPHSASLAKSALTLGFIGIWSFILLWPGMIILHFTGFETFDMPYEGNLVAFLITMGLDLILNLALLVGLQISSPLFMSIGSLLTIPTSVFVDKVFNHYVLPWQSFLGVLLVCLGFLGINLSQMKYFEKTRFSYKLNLRICGNAEEEAKEIEPVIQ